MKLDIGVHFKERPHVVVIARDKRHRLALIADRACHFNGFSSMQGSSVRYANDVDDVVRHAANVGAEHAARIRGLK